MKRKRYSEEQIAFALRQHEACTPVPDVIRTMGNAEQAFYRWKKKYTIHELGVHGGTRAKGERDRTTSLTRTVVQLRRRIACQVAHGSLARCSAS